MLEHTWHIFKTNVTLFKKTSKATCTLKISFNLLLQCENWTLMHNNEEVSCFIIINVKTLNV